MKKSTKMKVIPLALALVLAIVGAALAVPAITVNVQGVGQGEDSIVHPTQVDITWNLDSNNPDTLNGITVDVTDDPGSGTLYVKFYKNNTPVYEAKISLDGGGTYTVTELYPWDGSKFDETNPVSVNGVSIHGLAETNKVYVVYQGP